jgi:hypothetical protein
MSQTLTNGRIINNKYTKAVANRAEFFEGRSFPTATLSRNTWDYMKQISSFNKIYSYCISTGEGPKLPYKRPQPSLCLQ